MGIAFRHGKDLVAHELFERVDRHPGHHKPGAEGVPQGVEAGLEFSPSKCPQNFGLVKSIPYRSQGNLYGPQAAARFSHSLFEFYRFFKGFGKLAREGSPGLFSLWREALGPFFGYSVDKANNFQLFFIWSRL